MSTFLKKQSTALAEYDEPLVRRLVEKVTVCTASADAADKFNVEFKFGVTAGAEE